MVYIKQIKFKEIITLIDMLAAKREHTKEYIVAYISQTTYTDPTAIKQLIKMRKEIGYIKETKEGIIIMSQENEDLKLY